MSALTIFMSHSEADMEFCLELARSLRDRGADVWTHEDVRNHGELYIVIFRELQKRCIFVAVTSYAALDSEWVETECSGFYGLYKDDHSRVILPVYAETIDPKSPFRRATWLIVKDFPSIMGPNRTALPRDRAIQESMFALGLDLRGQEHYPPDVAAALLQHYRENGAICGPLGQFKTVSASDGTQITSPLKTKGYSRPFENGAVFWSERFGAQAVVGDIYRLYSALQGPSGRTGFPITGELVAATSLLGTSGVYQRFEGEWGYPSGIPGVSATIPYGATIYSSARGTYPTWSAIGERFERLRGTGGYLGFPTSAELPAAPSKRKTPGVHQNFERGVIYWSERGGAHSVHGGIGALYHKYGGSGSNFGFPLTEEIRAATSPQGTDGICQRFEGQWDYAKDIDHDPAIPYGATIYWSKKHRAQPTWGGIGELYERLHGTNSYLGFPVSPELDATPSPQGTTGRYQQFEGGIIVWRRKFNSIPVSGEILQRYNEAGGSGSQYGFPTSPETTTPSGQREQRFEGGIITVG